MEKITRRELREALPVGALVEVTNHWITREDHPCSGTSMREVLSNTSAGFYLTMPDAETMAKYPQGSRVEWPKASQVGVNDAGCIVILHEVDGVNVPFLTIRGSA